MKYRTTALLAGMLCMTGGALAQDLKVGDKAPALSAEEWIKGSEVKSFEKGRVYIVEFWATWCGPCIKGIPHLSEVQTNHADEGVTVIGVASYERKGRDNLIDFVTDSENGDAMKYTVAYDPDSSMGDDWMTAADQNGIPTSFIVDQDGKIAYIGHPSKMDSALAKVLAKGGTYDKAEKPDRTHDLMVGDKAPELAISEWVKGEPVTGFEKGRVYVVEFWATWCGPCIAGMPHVSELQKEYAEKGVQIIGVNIWDEPKNVEPFMEDRGDKANGDELMQYTVAIEQKDDENDLRNGVMAKKWMKAAGRNGIPSAFIIDQKGKVAWMGHPMAMDKPLEAIVNGEFDSNEEAERLAKEQNAQKSIQEYFGLFQDGEYDKAYPLGHKLVDGPLAENAQALNTLAWYIVDPENTPDKQDLDLALKAAKQANKLTEGEDPATLDTLAKVYWDKKDLTKALKYQRRAAELCIGTQFEDEIMQRLKWFEKEAKKRGG